MQNLKGWRKGLFQGSTGEAFIDKASLKFDKLSDYLYHADDGS